ncbi:MULTISPECIES: acetyl-CoA carboxylase biotin carboxyl carrier protein [unclassified Sporolactobacillus]|uniref:acetyl-CoA carboxylase biotin carboxyl carrier protein n=1 Tax=unclassified Sporolactobacillus TaxID=2628533 RepID=UPI0023674D6E|nr:acetyl-CoA carboxylase biotin carboxyl carrier protein [Sporolactobacillus sp. CQH2019]MDD9149298.1 acetyl-CoA carboxylase biotin carboxyl carrier protein [Sporolactobacillus sp. CQH2019]
MLSIEDIKALMKEMDASSISELKFESEDSKITLRKAAAFSSENPAVQPASQAAVAGAFPARETTSGGDSDSSLHKITAPMVGTFYASSSPDAEPFVKAGSKVDKATVVCIVEAMKLFNEIEAEVKGTIVDVLVENGQLVEYGQPLFLVRED